MQDDFGELRSLLHGAPSHGTWVRLCRLLGSLDDDQLGSVCGNGLSYPFLGWPSINGPGNSGMTPSSFGSLGSTGSAGSTT